MNTGIVRPFATFSAAIIEVLTTGAIIASFGIVLGFRMIFTLTILFFPANML